MTFVRAFLVTAAVAGCSDGGGFPDARPIDGPPANGTFLLDWTVSDTNNQAIACSTIGAQSVTVLLRNRAAQGGSTEVFTCQTLEGSASVPPGSYDLDFELNGLTGLIATGPRQTAIEITSGENVRLTPLAFVVDATGGLKLNLSTNTAGGNCAPAAASGAAIDTMTVTLEDATPACEPVTFAISAGAMGTAGVYTVNCASPTVVPCLHADQQLSVAGVPSGNYQLHVRGQIAGTDCWTNDDQIVVPPLGRDLTRTMNLALQTLTPGCSI